MSDAWYVDENSETADIRDENTLLVATAHDFDEARGIVREHNAFEGLKETVTELINLCAIGDVDETTEAYGWGDAIKRAKLALTKAEEL